MTSNTVNDYYIKKMCKFAETNYLELNDKDNPWKDNITWTRQQMNDFGKWMIDDLKSHKVKRHTLMGQNSKIKTEDFVGMWIAAFGFKLRDKKIEA